MENSSVASASSEAGSSRSQEIEELERFIDSYVLEYQVQGLLTDKTEGDGESEKTQSHISQWTADCSEQLDGSCSPSRGKGSSSHEHNQNGNKESSLDMLGTDIWAANTFDSFSGATWDLQPEKLDFTQFHRKLRNASKHPLPQIDREGLGKGKYEDGDSINLNDIEKVLPVWQGYHPLPHEAEIAHTKKLFRRRRNDRSGLKCGHPKGGGTSLHGRRSCWLARLCVPWYWSNLLSEGQIYGQSSPGHLPHARCDTGVAAPCGVEADVYLRMLQESSGAASPATVEVQLLASPTLACRQAWSKKGNAYLWQGAFPTLSKESVLPPHFCRAHANDLVLRNLAQPEAANGAKLFLLRYRILGQNVHGDLCIHPTFHPPLLSSTGVHQSLHKFFRGLGGLGEEPSPFSFARVVFSCKVGGRVFTDVSAGLLSLSLLQKDFTMREELQQRDVERWLGFITFLCEVFGTMRSSTGEPFRVLVCPIYTCLRELLQSQDVKEDAVLCCSMELQSTGRLLEEQLPEMMTELLAIARDKMLCPSESMLTRSLLLEVIELHANNWNPLTPTITQYYNKTIQKLTA
ncbi:CBP80/20-dependent translation initiation factor, partial [Spheniscus mendiculus]